jgi:endonuclease YncB( thermonuclease family)
MSSVKEQFAAVGLQVPPFSLAGTKTWARVVSVYDGDTMTLILPLFNQSTYYKFNVRMLGIDTSEIKSKLEENRIRAIRARNRVMQWVLPAAPIDPTFPYPRKQLDTMLANEVALVWVVCEAQDKYGRVLVNVYASPEDTTSFSQRLLHEKLAYPYQGETKLTEDQQAILG